MVIIIITVVTQGFRVPADLRGELKGSILIHSGIFEAIGVISFGKQDLLHRTHPKAANLL